MAIYNCIRGILGIKYKSVIVMKSTFSHISGEEAIIYGRCQKEKGRIRGQTYITLQKESCRVWSPSGGTR